MNSVQSASSCTITSELNFPLHQAHALLLARNRGIGWHHAAYFCRMIPCVNAARAGGLGGTVRLTARIARCLNSTCFRRSKYLVRPGRRGPYFSPFYLWDAFLHSGFTLSASYVRLLNLTLIVRVRFPGWSIFFHPFASRTSKIYLVYPYSEISQTQLFTSRVLFTDIAVLCSFI